MTIEDLKKMEPRLVILEKLCRIVSRETQQTIIEVWPVLYSELYRRVGFGREKYLLPEPGQKDRSFLYTSEAWDIAYPYFFDLSRGDVPFAKSHKNGMD